MKLYYDTTFLGEIQKVTQDDFWLVGMFHPDENAAPFRELFSFLAKDEKEPDDEPPCDDDIIFGNHWTIIYDEGRTRKIGAPAVTGDGEISWQW